MGMWRMVIVGVTTSLCVVGAGAAEIPTYGSGIVPQPATVTARREPARVALIEQRTSLPGLQRTETGLTWALGAHVAVQLNYTRTTNPPLMRDDHQNGVVTRLRLAF